MRNYRAECVVKADDLQGASPRWSMREQALWWLDGVGRRLRRFDPSSGALSSFPLNDNAASFMFTPDDRLLLNSSRGPVLFSPGGGVAHPLATPDMSPNERFNDGRCDRSGRCWTGTFVRNSKEPLGHLYRIGPDLRPVRMDSGLMEPTGLAWSPDDATMYVCEASPGRIHAYDFDPVGGTIGPRRVLADLSRSCGHPGGCAVDSAGFLWVAELNLWRIARFAPDGRRDAFISLPVRDPTCVAFGGDGLKTLFITTSRSALSGTELAEQPLAGGLFAVELPVRGMPECDFVGPPPG